MAGAGYEDIAVNRGLLLDLQFRDAIGGVTNDYAKPHHPVTLTGPPAWTDLANNLTVLHFNSAIPDFLESSAANTADLNFTTEDFSLALWVYINSLFLTRIIICRGATNTDGWYFFAFNTGHIQLSLMRAGTSRLVRSAAASVTADNWWLIGATRNGADGHVYINGVDATYHSDVLIDPLPAVRKLHIGIYDNEVNNAFWGDMWRPRIWNRALPAEEMLAIFEMERALFGV